MAAFSSASEKNWRLRSGRQNPVFGDLHASFDGGLIAAADTAWRAKSPREYARANSR